MPTFPNVKKMADGSFGPTDKNHYYMPVTYHNSTAARNRHKSKWCIKQNQQYEVFRIADEGSWKSSTNNGLFSIMEQGNYIVGFDDEVLSFFPCPANPSDFWHGFPVKSQSKRPDSDLLDRWFNEGVIDYSARIRIERGLL